MKTCFKCHRSLEVTEFYRNACMADGTVNKCKKCTCADMAAHRRANLKAIRAYDRERAKLPHRAEMRKRLIARELTRHPERRTTRARTQYLGLKAPAKCSLCGRLAKVQKHHADYSDHTLFAWVCKPCHYVADKLRQQAETENL